MGMTQTENINTLSGLTGTVEAVATATRTEVLFDLADTIMASGKAADYNIMCKDGVCTLYVAV